MGYSNKWRNIWIFHHYATPPTMNGFTRPYDFGIQLKNYGYDVTVFAASYLHFSEKNLIEDKNKLYIIDEYNKIPFVFINTWSSTSTSKRIMNMISYYRGLFKTIKALKSKLENPDLIIASSPHPLTMVAGIKISRQLNVPCICEVRDFWPEVIFKGGKLKENGLIGRTLLKWENWIYEKSDSIVFLKEGDINYITDKGWDLEQGGNIDLNKCYYINNGVDIKAFNEKAKGKRLADKDLSGDKFNVIYAGAIRPVNNIGNILDTAKILEEYTDIQFLIYGEGNQIDDLKKRIKDESLNNVKMKGYVEKFHIPYILSKSSVNILNYSQSRYNWSRGNSSNKLFEYMASGKPIISTIKMGYSIIQKYNCGIELEKNTPEELAKAILKIKGLKPKEYKKLGDNARYGAKDFDFQNLTNKLVSVINNTIGRHNYD